MVSVNTLLLEETIRHQIELQRYEAGVVARMIAVIDRADKRIAAELAVALQEIDPSLFKMERLESLLTSIRELSKAAHEQIGKDMREELKEFNAYELSYQHQALVAHLPAVVHVASVSANQVYTAAMARPFQGVLLKEVWKDLDAQAMKRLRQTIANGFVEGKTTDQIIREVRGTRANNFKDGIVEKSRRDIEAVVRTAIANVAGVAQDNMMEANADLLKAVQWSSTLDLRTSSQCFPESTLALPVGDLRGIFKRAWNGDLIVVTTSSGKKLRSTPNHPVLTARGWRPIQELNPGIDVLYRVSTDVRGITSSEDIEMPSTLGAIFDALSEPAFSNVSIECASEADFHGDGMIGKNKVNYPRSESDLRLALISKFGHEIAEKLLILVAGSSILSALGKLDEVGFCLEFVNMPPEFDSGSIEDCVKAGFADVKLPENFGGLHPALESGNKNPLVGSSHGFSASKGLHNSSTFKDSGDGCGGDAKCFSNSGCGNSIGVFADDVVSVEREFFSGHVYNLSTGSELYIADGFVVHNCRIRDKLLYTPVDHKPIGHKVLWLQGPGRLHWRCRSGRTPVLKSHKELGIDVPEIVIEGKTRASMDGQVAAETTYADWLKKQSAARQDEVLGPTRGRLMREGKLSLDDMYSARGKPLTLDELRKKDAEAFKLAGL